MRSSRVAHPSAQLVLRQGQSPGNESLASLEQAGITSAARK